MSQKPPKYAQLFLSLFLKKELAEEVLGDLDERFLWAIEKKGSKKAKRQYWYEVLNYLRPFAIRKINSKFINQNSMLRHDLLISMRSFKRHKSTFAINLVGLACGLSCAILIYFWANNELSMDSFHSKSDQIYQVLQNAETAAGTMTMPYTPAQLATTLQDQFPEVELATSVLETDYFEGDSYLVYDNGFVDMTEQFVDENFFDFFDYPMIVGNEKTLFEKLGQIFVSESLAKNTFGFEEAIGQTVRIQNEELDKDFVIAGIFKDVPNNSSLKFDVLFNMQDFISEASPNYINWNNNNPSTFVILNKNADLAAFNKAIYSLVENYISYKGTKLIAQKQTERHLYGQYKDGVVVGGKIAYVRLFVGVGLVVLLIACINFTNLTTAKAQTRLKELGVKKTMGANRLGLIRQYITEALLISAMSGLLSMVIIYAILPYFNQLTGLNIAIQWSLPLVLGLIVIIASAAIIAGLYPSLYLSRIQVIPSLKGTLKGGFGDIWARRGLVVFQFVTSMILISSVFIITQQIKYIQSVNLGYDRENVLFFTNTGIYDSHNAMFNELRTISGVTSVAGAGHDLMGNYGRTGGVRWPGQNPEEKLSFINIEAGPGFLQTMGIELLEGSNYDLDDASMYNKVLFNETAIAKMGLEDPIGKMVKVWGKDRQIIGIVKDFHALNLYNEMEPTMIFPIAEDFSQTFIKVNGINLIETIEKIEETFATHSNGSPLKLGFVDDHYEAMYQNEKQIASLAKLFTAIAILITCLGLIGLTSFIAEKKTKEIGIRKVLGSGNWRIVNLLSKEFMGMILIATLISLPLGYLLAQNWIDNFAYSIEIKWWFFLITAVVVIGISWMTILSQAIRAIQKKIVDSLRYE